MVFIEDNSDWLVVFHFDRDCRNVFYRVPGSVVFDKLLVWVTGIFDGVFGNNVCVLVGF